jgi:hypothetical protein
LIYEQGRLSCKGSRPLFFLQLESLGVSARELATALMVCGSVAGHGCILYEWLTPDFCSRDR